VLPDIDKSGSSVARLCGPLTEAVARLTNRLSGGHRQGTHSVLAVFGAGLLGLVLTPWSTARAVAVGLLLALALRVLAPPPIRFRIVCFGIAAAMAWSCGDLADTLWVAPALATGVALHLVGDALTIGGVPLFWPNRRMFSFPLLGRSGSTRETVLAIPVWVVFVGLALAALRHELSPWLEHVASLVSVDHLSG